MFRGGYLRDMKGIVHDLEVIDLNPGHVELGVCSSPTSVYVILEPEASFTR